MTEEEARSGSDLEVVASLAEPVRRVLYDFVSASEESVGRDAAAAATGVSRQVAAYHLDRLADDGLLGIEFRRLTGRAGPGAGRPAKLYHRSDREYDVSVPPRRYEVAARILLAAAGGGAIDRERLALAAREVGEQLGRSTSGLEEALEELGYEPVDRDGEIRFRNCPFHVLREQDRVTTCGMNHSLVEGLVEGAGATVDATLAPEDGYCCVRIRPSPT